MRNPIKVLFESLEQTRLRMEREANDPNHIPWQQKHGIGKTVKPDTTFDGAWQTEAERNWNERNRR